MRTIRLLIICLAVCNLQAAFSWRSTVTVDHTKVQSSVQSNFAVGIIGTYTDLKTVGNSGFVQNASGFDVGFYTNSDCSTGKMKWETELYTASTGAVVYWVKNASVSNLTDTVFYMCFGDSGITTDQSDKVNTWDANYSGVWHLADNAATTTVVESTTSAATGTAQANTSTKTVAGQVGTALTFNGSTDFVDMGNVLNAVWGASTSFTLEAWIKPAGASAATKAGIITKSANTFAGPTFAWRDNAGNHNYYEGFDGVANPFGYNTTVITAAVWSHVVYVRDKGATTGRFYLNGSPDGTITDASGDMSSVQPLRIGGSTAVNNGALFNGVIDEVRISNALRSADWIKTAYNNEFSPGTFYSVGAKQAVAASTAACGMMLLGIGGCQ